MFDYVGCDELLGTSPPSRPNLAEGSELFRSVMEDFIHDQQLSRNDNRDGVKIEPQTGVKSNSNLCRRCLSVTIACKCKHAQRDRRSPHRVQWADETCDRPLAKRLEIDCDSPMSCSPPLELTETVKPILKHRANCIIIIAE